jgi:hypothetical protein
MRTRSIWRTAVILAGSLALLSTLLWFSNRQLTLEVARLEIQHRELGRLEQESTQLQSALRRLRQLRQAQARLEVARQAALAKEPADEPSDLAPGFTAIAGLSDKGNRTLRAAAETYLWALDHLDVPALSRLIMIDPRAHAKLAALYAALPDSAREQYGNAAELLATLYASQQRPPYYAAVQIAPDEPDPGTLVANPLIQYEFPGGRTRSHQDLALIHTPQGWQIPVALSQVDQLLTRLDQGTTAP